MQLQVAQQAHVHHHLGHDYSVNLTRLILSPLNIIIQCVYLLLAHFVVPEKTFHGANSEEALLLKGCTGALHLLYTWAE